MEERQGRNSTTWSPNHGGCGLLVHSQTYACPCTAQDHLPHGVFLYQSWIKTSHTYRHAHRHGHGITYTHAHTCIHTCTHMYTHMHIHMHTYVHTHAYTLAHHVYTYTWVKWQQLSATAFSFCFCYLYTNYSSVSPHFFWASQRGRSFCLILQTLVTPL